ncbi:Mu transposase C-terminal domain-containing protein [Oceanobacillus sp. ISL-73]|uniref:Mu transposase C-terminal domain-containing protein n=1 Tax=Oceanobacillus sp. ISL-73 TaxID=2819161 RepID=UPI001BE99F98|nr:Mu transposase C-terminal domain-containing protein [Oceanobacillus sp. ISL-73]MBT2653241.1 DDE-type integrase/transposase/recombinase [Oceanobacillus sp. ISL-73]
MNFYVNEILQDSIDKQYRILWIDSGNFIMYLIELENKNAFPEKKLVSNVEGLIILGEWKKLKEDIYIKNNSYEYEKKHYQVRDNVWNMIKSIVEDEPNVYKKNLRIKLMSEVSNKHKVSYPTVRKYLYKYWSRGKTINALLPDYINSGAKGKERLAGAKKRGRPSTYSEKGINVDEETKEIFRSAIGKYYLSSKQNTLSDTYKFMLKRYYAKDIYYEKGVEKVILEDENKIPSIDQLRYWYKKEYNSPEILKSRKGEKRFNKDHRAVLNTSLSEVHGPGSRYQIDATIGDVYLVSEVNRNWIIGRPVIYIIIDVFSRMVVGMYVGLEGPSWAGAMLALENVVANKKDYCEEFGIEIKEEDWPCKHLPEVLLADKGEFEGFNVERLVRAFNLHVENASAYRADWKGIVEKQFDLIQVKVKPMLPGYINADFQERGSRDYRLDATLTLKEFTKVLIKLILQYNTKHYLKSYVRDRDLVAQSVKPMPLQLWNWGIENRTGKLRVFPEELVKMQLLPQDSATVNFKGIQFKGISYSCDKAVKDSWFENARMKGSWKVNLAYNPKDMTHVYLIGDREEEFEICHLLSVSKRYEGLSLEEVTYWRQEESYLEKKENHNQLQKEVNFIADVETIIKEAENELKTQKDSTLSKSEQIRNIRVNRDREKKLQRKSEIYQGVETGSTEVVNFPTDDDKLDYKRKNVREFLKRRKEKEHE